MGTLRLILDPTGRYDISTATIIVEDPGEYTMARRRIYAHLETPGTTDLCVVVRNPAFTSRFDDLRQCPGVDFEFCSPRADLELALGRALPPDMMDLDVIELRLDDLLRDSPPAINEGVEAWIAKHRVGPAWVSNLGPVTNLREAVACLANGELDNVWLARFVSARLHDWGRGREWSTVWEYLAIDPTVRARALAGYSAIRRYPKPKRKEWLGELWTASGVDAFDDADRVAQALAGIKPPEVMRRHLEQSVQEFINERLTTGAELETVLAYATGAIATEVPVLVHYLERSPQSVTPYVVRVIESIASADDRALVGRLNRLLPVDAPVTIDPSWTSADFDNVAEWFTDAYLPWYRAVRHRREVTRGHDLICGSFASWLIRSYPDLLATGRETILGIRDRVNELVSSGRPVIWIIVDALGADWSEAIVNEGIAEGLELTSQRHVLTMLPTITWVAKPSLISGVPPSFRGDSRVSSVHDYQALASAQSWAEVGGVSLAAEWQDADLSEFIGRERKAVWIYLVNRLDQSVAHQVMSFGDRASRVSTTCKEVILAAKKAQEAALSAWGQRPAVIVTSDHGFTAAAADPVVASPPAGEMDGRRCVVLDPDSGEITRDGWVLLEPPEAFGLTNRVAVVYGNRFLGETSSLFASHGGANPEEVFVPYIEFGGIPAVLKKLNVRLLTTLKPDADEQDCELLIGNPNLMPVLDVELVSTLFAEPVSLSLAAGMSEVTLRVRTTRGPHATGVITVPIRVTYRTERTSATSVDEQLIGSVARPLQAEDPNRDAFEEMFGE